MIKRAKPVRTKDPVGVHARPLSGQTTIEAAFSQRPPKPLRPPPKSAPPTSTPTTSHGGTRAMPRFNIDDEPDLQAFETWLQGVEGKERTPKAAREITTDVSKFLRFCAPTRKHPRWEDLCNKDNVLNFLAELERCGMGPDGRLTKLDNLQTGLRFVRLHILGGKPNSNYPGVYEETYTMEELVSTYKRSIRKKKMKKNEERLAELSETPLELSEISKIVDCQPMLDDLHDLVRVAEVTGELDEEQLGRTTMILAALLLYKSWQRPGAVCNATLHEFRGASLVLGEGAGGKDVYVLSVREHKTGVKGAARLMLDASDWPQLKGYVEHVRPLLDPEGKSPHLLLLPGCKQLDNVHHRVKRLGARYGFSAPTATKVRKIGATNVALRCGETEAKLITRQMSHTGHTQAKHYEGIVGTTHAASAFRSMEALRRQAPETDSQLLEEEEPLKEKEKPLKEKEEPLKKQEPAKKRKRVNYTEEEEEELRKYFATEIAHNKLPTRFACEEFTRDHLWGRSKDQIYHKVKNLVNSA